MLNCFVHIITSKHFALKFDFTVRDLLRESVQIGENITVISVCYNKYFLFQHTKFLLNCNYLVPNTCKCHLGGSQPGHDAL